MNVTNRELLEGAARSCGYTYLYQKTLNPDEEYLLVKELDSKRWNPLVNLLDCAKMCVHLRIDVEWFHLSGYVLCKMGATFAVVHYSSTTGNMEEAWKQAAVEVAYRIEVGSARMHMASPST